MIKRLGIEKIEGRKLVPVAAIAASKDWFGRLGIAVESDADDMDDYDIAAFTLVGTSVFAFMRYHNAPNDDVTLLVEERASSEAAFTGMIRKIAARFDVPPSAFHWKSDGQDVHLAEREESIRARA